MPSDGPRLTLAGKLFVLLFVAACSYGAYRLMFPPGAGNVANNGGDGPKQSGGPKSTTSSTTGPEREGPAVEIGIAYGTEKEQWLKPAAREFEASPAGRGIKINLIPKGSLEGAQAIYRDKDAKIHVWSPASSLYRDVFVQNWQTENSGKDPIAKEQNLALSPMVFVFWEERYQAFKKKLGEPTFDTISQALLDPGGWQSIAGEPDWGLFKYGHTHPNASNSGLMTLVLMAYDYNKKSRGLEVNDLLSKSFHSWFVDTENATSGFANSTGPMMKDMVLYGPSKYDALCVYESVVIDYLRQAEGRWGTLHVAYPKSNMWNDNPYYILDVPWSDENHRKAAEAFLEYLMSDAVQKDALKHGFRPGNPQIGLKDADSPFVLYEKQGLKINLNSVCEPPKAQAVNTLIDIWERGVHKK